MLTLVLALTLGTPALPPGSAAASPACRSLCSAASAALRECRPSQPETCDVFLAAAERLSGHVECADVGFRECARDVPADAHPKGGAAGFLAAYLGALNRLSSPPPPVGPQRRQRALHALSLVGSRASAVALEDRDEEWDAVIRHARALSQEGVLDDEELSTKPWRRYLAETPPRTARASSTLPAQGRDRHDAALAVDGRDGTAWCAARTPGDPWIEVTVSRPEGARFPGLVLVPGFGRGLVAFQRNNRILRLRVSDCAAPDEGEVVDLPASDGTGAEGEPPRDVLLKPYGVPAPAAFRDGTTDCVRLTVLEVARGRDDETCISEIVPVRTR